MPPDERDPNRDEPREDERDDKRVQSRADALTADELEAGSDDPHAQAEAILADSDARAEGRVSSPGNPVESGQSDDNVQAEDPT